MCGLVIVVVDPPFLDYEFIFFASGQFTKFGWLDVRYVSIRSFPLNFVLLAGVMIGVVIRVDVGMSVLDFLLAIVSFMPFGTNVLGQSHFGFGRELGNEVNNVLFVADLNVIFLFL